MVTREQLFEELQEWYKGQQNRWGLFDALEDDVYEPGIDLPSGRLLRVAGEGGEGEGTTYFYVFSIGEQLFRVDGYWASWDGVTYSEYIDALHEVEAVPTTVIEYKRK
jgi:hypothetical protein